MSDAVADYLKARRHLARRCAIMKALIAKIGPCTLKTLDDRFAVLVRSIVAQQISGKAARSISARLEQSLGKLGLHPKAIARADEATLRAAGLSTAKMRAVRDLAARVLDGSVVLDNLHELDDEAIIGHLTPVRGIGRWTAEMFLIFGLGRLDVLPLADLGLRVGVQRQLGLKQIPDKKHITEIAEAWRPYRTVATWYLWRSFGPVPQSE